jgi:IS5 family transposase
MSQLTFASLAYQQKKKVTRREKFLSEMSSVLPWVELESVISPFYPDIGNGRPPIGLRRMLKIYFMQQWFNLSDPAMEDSLYDSESMRRFAEIELGRDAVPDETTILKFRHLLEEQECTKALFEQVREHLTQKGLMVREGTIVDATIIDAPTSTKNANKTRDPEMRQTKKGNTWFFGMKIHIGAEMSRGLVHNVVCTPANINEIKVLDELVHGDEELLYGDCAYVSKKCEEHYESQGTVWKVSRKSHRDRPLTKRDRIWNRSVSRVRALVEHAFGVVKNTWGHRKVRYRGIRKNTAQFFTLFALANLFMVRRELLKLQTRPSG